MSIGDVHMPKLGETMVEGTIVRWLASEGSSVTRDEPLVVIETDKVELEVPSPTSGCLVRILLEDGATCPVGTLIGVIAE